MASRDVEPNAPLAISGTDGAWNFRSRRRIWSFMDVTRIIAERRIEEAIADGRFDDIPKFGYIDCSLSGERFFSQWFAKKLEREGYTGRSMLDEDALPAPIPRERATGDANR